MITEIKFAVRSLRQTPAVALAAVLCLALGLGATTAISSAVNAALLAPLPFAKPDRLVSVFRTTPHFRSGPFSPPNFRDLAREARVVEGLAAMGTGSAVLETSDGGVQIPVVGATGSLFPTLGARARVGRLLGPTDEDPAEPLTVVLGYDLWVGRFGGSPEVIGQTVRLDGTPRIVVGVTPDGFRVPHGGNLIEPEAWVPLRFTSDQLLGRRNNHLMVLGRLRDGATVAAARGEMDQLMGRLVAAHPELSGEGIAVESMAAAARAPIRTPLLLLFGAVGLVLVIAAANVASLLLARGTGRRRELAVRAALGASRGDIVRRVLAETGVLVAAGTAGGLVLALLGVRVIGSMAAVRFPQLADLGLDWPAVGFALLLALVVTAACGLVPALRAAAVDPQETLRASDQRTGVGARHHRFLRGIAVAEVALSLTLLVDAGLVIRGFVALTNQPPGFDPAPLLTLQVAVPARGADDRPADRFLEPALAAVAEVPGVESVGVIDLLPYAAWGNNFNVRYEGRVPEADPTRAPLVERRIVSPGLFAALGMAPVAGRLFEPGDGPDAPLVIVANRALAVRDFGGRNPIGQRIQLGSTTFATIVGVVGDIKNAGPERAPAPEVYFSYRQTNRGASAFSFVVRAQGDPAAVAGPASAAIRQADPSAAVGRIRPMTEVVARSVGRPRFLVTLLGAFAAVAVVLAMAGLYGLMSYTVAQRRREIGIRMALGSGAGRTVGLVLGQGGRLVAIGMALGLAGGVATSRLLAGLLYGVSPGDLGTWAATIGVLAATALLALLVPARRATATDPVEVIRD